MFNNIQLGLTIEMNEVLLMNYKKTLMGTIGGSVLGAGIGGVKGLEKGLQIGITVGFFVGVTFGVLGSTVLVIGRNKIKGKTYG